ncbi:MAG: hypothetical protein LBH14_07635 [Desulfobulbaceae bacterium]|nr:hypothetical protein [Desulfobulbaceae bacterium]
MAIIIIFISNMAKRCGKSQRPFVGDGGSLPPTYQFIQMPHPLLPTDL